MSSCRATNAKALIAELRELDKKAVAGPLVFDEANMHIAYEVLDSRGNVLAYSSGDFDGHEPLPRADAMLFVAMRNALPELLDYIKRLERVVATDCGNCVNCGK